MGKLIDGKKLAQIREQELKKKIQKLDGRPKVVSILIGDDPASIMYTEMKQKKAAELEIDFEPLRYAVNTPFGKVAEEIKSIDTNNTIVGIMVQLPMPKEFLGFHQPNELLELIDPKKDIDGLNPLGSNFVPATVKGILSILSVILANSMRPGSSQVDSIASLQNDKENESVSAMLPPISSRVLDKVGTRMTGITFAVVGSEGEVGQSLVYELTQRAGIVIKVDRKLPETSLADLKDANVVISATGVKNLIKPEMIKEQAVLIDVGGGEFEEDCFAKASFYTPKYGGVGPMTVISLMENIVEAAGKVSA